MSNHYKNILKEKEGTYKEASSPKEERRGREGENESK